MPGVLQAIGPEVSGLEWRVLDLGEVVHPEPPVDELVRVIDAVDASDDGVATDFAGLLRFADLARQVIDGLFVGLVPGTGSPRRSDSDQRILEVSVVVVAVLDSSFWLISGPDVVLEAAMQAFPAASTVREGSPPLSTWGRS